VENFTNRCLAFLSNPDELNNQDIEQAYNEAMQIVKNKDVCDAFISDIAFYRYLLIIKSEFKDEYYDDYKTAIKEVDKAKNKPNDEGVVKGFDVVVGRRSRLW
jgi:hypothetical protein